MWSFLFPLPFSHPLKHWLFLVDDKFLGKFFIFHYIYTWFLISKDFCIYK
jgi:hypothetical protein